MLDYTDCVNPTKIRRVGDNVCHGNMEQPSSAKKMYLVQPRTVTRLQGYKFKIKESRGEQMHTGNGLVDDLMELLEYSILVESEEFVAQGQLVESKSDHVELPCKLNTGGCETGDGTFIYSYTPTCSFEKIQVFTGTRVMGSYLADAKKAILLNVTGVTMAPQVCGSVRLLSSNYLTSWGTLHPADLHITIQERVREDYLAYKLEKQMQSVQEMLTTTVCQQQVAGSEEVPQRLPNGQYAYRRGDVLFVLRCVQKRGAIAKLSNCYDKILIDQSGQVWVDPTTRLCTQHATQLPCSSKFPLTIQVANNTWVAVTPALAPVAAPEQLTLEEDNAVNHLDMAVRGPYTEVEQREWEQILEYPSYHKALLKLVTVGSCVETDSCAAGVSALVLVIMAVRMIVHVSVMVMAYLQGGPAMAPPVTRVSTGIPGYGLRTEMIWKFFPFPLWKRFRKTGIPERFFFRKTEISGTLFLNYGSLRNSGTFRKFTVSGTIGTIITLKSYICKYNTS